MKHQRKGRSRWRREVLKFSDRRASVPLPIVGANMVASTGFADGRAMPVLIVDTSSRPDVTDLMKAHAEQPPGDVEVVWGHFSKSKRSICLVLRFQRPSKVEIVLDFDIPEQGIMVEAILAAKAVYLQPGKPGDSFSPVVGRISIIVEVPHTGFQQEWPKIFQRQMETFFRQDGLGRAGAKEAAEKAVEQAKAIVRFRIRGPV